MKKELKTRLRNAFLLAVLTLSPYVYNNQRARRVDAALSPNYTGCPPAEDTPIDALVVADAGADPNGKPNPMTRTAIEDGAFSYENVAPRYKIPNIIFLNGLHQRSNMQYLKLTQQVARYYSHHYDEPPDAVFQFHNNETTQEGVDEFSTLASQRNISHILLTGGPNRNRAALLFCEKGFQVTLIHPTILRKHHRLSWGEIMSGRPFRGDPIKQRVAEWLKLFTIRYFR